jgi:ubiquinone/menaquinone biosynthesis C-methylase UbiE
MKNHQQQELMEYYDERAPEYDEIYLGGTPGMPEPQAYREDVEAIKAICRSFGRGHLIDIGCGTGYWLPHYGKNCAEITLVDQSRKMLAECQKRVKELNADLDVHFVKGNFFDIRFFSKVHNTAVIAFLVSHLNEESEGVFWRKLKRILTPKAEMLWIDGSWSQTRKKHRAKEGSQKRTLNDGRSFTVFKKYYDEKDIQAVANKYSFTLHSLYMGEVFFAARAALRS